MIDFKKDFPLLCGNDIVYLDSAATTQKPQSVISAIKNYYMKTNANPFRGMYDLSMTSTDLYEQARSCVAQFICADPEQIVFTRNATQSINLVAYSYALNNLRRGDEIVVTITSHHSNFLPWKMVADKTGALLRIIECEPDGFYSTDVIDEVINEHTKIAAVETVSNVTGYSFPFEYLIERVHLYGGIVLVDGTQSVAHRKTDVKNMDCDFFVFSGHKMYASMGIGVLYGKRELLEKMEPFMLGGQMIDSVSRNDYVCSSIPHKFEAGTVNVSGAISLMFAIHYIWRIGFADIRYHELSLADSCMSQLRTHGKINIIGSQSFAACYNSIISFTMDGIHPYDIANILASDNICVRSGHHCAQPLMKHLGIDSCVRVSFGVYNTYSDVEKFLEKIFEINNKKS